VGRDERRAFVDAGKRLLEQARLANVDGDVVDPAAVPIRLLTLDLHERLQLLRVLRQQDVVVRRHQVEHSRHEQEHGPEAEEDVPPAEPLHGMLRVRPPSTGIVAPVT
jgi:hypothetical protein